MVVGPSRVGPWMAHLQTKGVRRLAVTTPLRITNRNVSRAGPIEPSDNCSLTSKPIERPGADTRGPTETAGTGTQNPNTWLRLLRKRGQAPYHHGRLRIGLVDHFFQGVSRKDALAPYGEGFIVCGINLLSNLIGKRTEFQFKLFDQ